MRDRSARRDENANGENTTAKLAGVNLHRFPNPVLCIYFRYALSFGAADGQVWCASDAGWNSAGVHRSTGDIDIVTRDVTGCEIERPLSSPKSFFRRQNRVSARAPIFFVRACRASHLYFKSIPLAVLWLDLKLHDDVIRRDDDGGFAFGLVDLSVAIPGCNREHGYSREQGRELGLRAHHFPVNFSAGNPATSAEASPTLRS